VIREATLADVAAIARLSSLVYPAEVTTARGLRHRWASVPARARRRMWLAETDAGVVGFAAAALAHLSAEPGAAIANVYVDPRWRRQGIATALWQLVEPHLAELGATHVNSFGLDEEPSRRFMGARGFEVRYVQRMSRLDLAALDPPPSVPDGVELVPFAAVDDLWAIWALEAEGLRDVPVDQPLDDVRFEDWEARLWADPDLDREASLLALRDGEPAAFTSFLSDPESGRATSAMTATARRARWRGLASLVKHHGLARLAAAGFREAVTENDEQNAPMLRVNERLGYRPTAANATFSRRG
jgi:GNAT superfamily N-acetyltransferase